MITQEKFNEFNFHDLKLEMFWSGKTGAYGKCQMEYRLFKGEKLLIEGENFLLGGSMYPDSIQAVATLLSFLTLKKGDTDEEYFKDYSNEMLEFTESSECEEINSMCNDMEDEEYKREAEIFFESHSKINAF